MNDMVKELREKMRGKTMKRIKIFFILLVLIGALMTVLIGCASFQPRPHPLANIPMDNIPASTPADVRAQIVQLYSEDPVVRAYALNALKKMGPNASPAIPFLIAMLADESGVQHRTPDMPAGEWILDIVGSMAEEALVKIGTSAVEPLIALLKDKNDRVRNRSRNWAVNALGKIGDKRAIEPLIAVLQQDSDGDTRMRAAIALGNIGDKRAVEPLIVSLQDSYLKTRIYSARSLKRITGEMYGVDALIAILRKTFTGSVDMKELVAEVLKEITGEDFGENDRKWQKWWDNRTKNQK